MAHVIRLMSWLKYVESSSSFFLQMLMKLHDDDDYQNDVGDPKALDAIILELQKHPDRFERQVSL